MTSAPQPERRHAYHLAVTADEWRTLEWLEGHGYSGDLIKHADAVEETEGDGKILHYFESSAWNVQGEYESDVHAYGACATHSLLRKMHAFLEAIV